ncbi:S-layer homology domain-containing protein [Acutalibacter caecimuris]|uniref:S-layer homology domain-containing protein n=1 Tax=Acutalibacter caecimuris TaxID=3093657 RepID=UPI002AC9A0A6|nr:S-layer homology domain-containing protein [Acutalibacter sp. M00118]
MNRSAKNLKRLTALLLCAILALGALPFDLDTSLHAAASWATPYVEKLQGWGVMQGYGNGNMGENDTLTRAQMAAMLNRAYGYNRTGPIPFTDVPRNAWYYDDIAVAYTEGIMAGTSPTTASPNAPVTREQALVLLARAMRLDPTPGEVTEFTDGHNFSSYSAPYVRSAVLSGIISGMTDGSFQPGGRITRGQVARMLSSGVGNLINTRGETSLGGVFGNVTINTNNVTLRDTVIAGDLYITGGLGLGDVLLDNVRVLGRIVIAGGGESEGAKASILLNNVTAQKLQVDPSTGQYVSVRAIGSTDIPKTVVKSPSYIQDDVRDKSKGLREISLEGPEGSAFTVAGNLKNVVNRTPGSTLTIGDTGAGSATSVTIDETATNSKLVLDINASVDEVNLDTATEVTGNGDIGTLNVSTNGSSCDILPDKVVVRPGVVTQIKDMTNVDSEIAKEISSDPRLLQGYPKVKNVAPTTADGYFSVNKAGTIYWALTNAATGPLEDVDADSLITPSDYGSGFMLYGNIKAETSKTEYSAQLTGMETGGTYYLSAVLLDAHGRKSPVKSQKILTPDGTVPALTAGFPTIADRTPTRNDENADMSFGEIVDLQATVMANKTCDLYYVLLPKGSTQPQTSEFLSSSFVDPYGFGRIHMIKNTMDSFKVNEVDMNLDGVVDSLGEVEENTEYDLYLWLTDADGSKSSRITKTVVRTKDITPPEFNLDEMIQSATQATSVRLTNSVNEAGTVYWVAVNNGTPYPVPKDGMSSTDPAFLKSEYAKLQVINGQNSDINKFGKVTVRANTDFNITISGLTAERAYDVYYVAVDAAGNCSDPVKKFTAHTLDSNAPTAEQQFENVPEDSPTTPYADSTINIVFNEDIRYKQPSGSTADPYEDPNLLNLYTNYAQAKKDNPAMNTEEAIKAQRLYVEALRDMFVLNDASTRRPVAERTDQETEWTIDYRNVQVYKDGAKLIVSFINNGDTPTSSLNLESGAGYYFTLKNIADESERHNQMNTTQMPTFNTVSAQVVVDAEYKGKTSLQAFDREGNPIVVKTDDGSADTTDIPIDIAFTAEPRSTMTTADGICWDMLFWFDTSVEFRLFTRIKGNVDDPWTPVGDKDKSLSISVPDSATSLRGVSVIKVLGENDFQDINGQYAAGGTHCGLNDADDTVYEYALYFTRIGNNTNRSTFSQRINGQVTFVSGAASSLGNLANTLSTSSAFDNVVNNRGNITDITDPKDIQSAKRILTRQFSDGRAPQLLNKTPTFTPHDSSVSMYLQLDRAGTVYYVLAPVEDDDPGNITSVLSPRDESNATIANAYDYIAPSGAGVLVDGTGKPDPAQGSPNGKTLTTSNAETDPNYKFSYPNGLNIMNPAGTDLNSPLLVTGSKSIGVATEPVEIQGLAPSTTYYVYLVTQGVSDVLSPVTVYKFTTEPVSAPIITLDHGSTDVSITSDMDGTVYYMLIVDNETSMDGRLKDLFYTNKLYDPSKETELETLLGLKKDSYTVLDALLDNYAPGGESKGSVFDCFASADEKTRIYSYISSTSATTGNEIGRGSVSVKAGTPVPIDCATEWGKDKLQMGLSYIFLTTGESIFNSGYGFRATKPIQLVDSTPLKITAVAPPFLNYANDTITGQFSLEFDDNLYARRTENDRNIRIPLDTGPVTHGTVRPSGSTGAGYLSVADFVSFNGGAFGDDLKNTSGSATIANVRVSPSGIGQSTQTIAINLNRAPATTYITIRSTLCDQYLNPQTVNLVITFDIDQTTGRAKPVITTPEWDGRTNR